MNSISNDFITIDYENKYQEKLATYCIELFNSNPEFYKGLFNGKTSIHCGELPIIIIDEENSDYNKMQIENSILRMNSAINIRSFNKEILEGNNIYDSFIRIMYGTPSEEEFKLISFELAYEYFDKTKDFTYLKKFLYEDSITEEDLVNICHYELLNNFEKLLRGKTTFDIRIMQDSNISKEYLKAIITMSEKVLENVYKQYRKIGEYISFEDLPLKIDYDIISKIEDEHFEKLVMESLAYVDPTNNLVEEYLECKKEGRIHLFERTSEEEADCFFVNNDDYGINLYRRGNLIDVISLMHEFGHLHHEILRFKESGRRYVDEFTEYPSIYYELKTAEYLEQKGYSEKEIVYAKSFRSDNDFKCLSYLLPSLENAYENYEKGYETFEISKLKKASELYDVLTDEIIMKQYNCSKEEARTMIDKFRLYQRYHILRPTKEIGVTLRYVLGTYLAEYSLNNLKHEDVLSILNKKAKDESYLYDLIEMNGLDPKIFITETKEDIQKKKEDINSQ